tara:strand:+ start:1537 stop:1761 length:225 start_codon:yes stop_codon:yes gene_type:complete
MKKIQKRNIDKLSKLHNSEIIKRKHNYMNMCETMVNKMGYGSGKASSYYKKATSRHKIKRITGDPRPKVKWRLN